RLPWQPVDLKTDRLSEAAYRFRAIFPEQVLLCPATALSGRAAGALHFSHNTFHPAECGRSIRRAEGPTPMHNQRLFAPSARADRWLARRRQDSSAFAVIIPTAIRHPGWPLSRGSKLRFDSWLARARRESRPAPAHPARQRSAKAGLPAKK